MKEYMEQSGPGKVAPYIQPYVTLFACEPARRRPTAQHNGQGSAYRPGNGEKGRVENEAPYTAYYGWAPETCKYWSYDSFGYLPNGESRFYRRAHFPS